MAQDTPTLLSTRSHRKDRRCHSDDACDIASRSGLSNRRNLRNNSNCSDGSTSAGRDHLPPVDSTDEHVQAIASRAGTFEYFAMKSMNRFENSVRMLALNDRLHDSSVTVSVQLIGRSYE